VRLTESIESVALARFELITGASVSAQMTVLVFVVEDTQTFQNTITPGEMEQDDGNDEIIPYLQHCAA
jgi:hypothetical protein